ncbi:MAG TPA: class I SAM-dependent methyltransferase [Burkholderiaceae bacterium]|nr:class I SAM-dependent methyltransferase [Burkholderiaceae bacterium]HSC01168.1 class I SAM-dependent methyltransferase [Burkholderiaceae bacterium]
MADHLNGAGMGGQEAHYSARDIETRILTALRAAGLNPEQRLSPAELGALDHFHTGGFRASLVLKELAQIRADDRVLDVGAGLAGPARMLAASPGCRVDCIELSPDYCVAATLLNKLTGLQDLVDVHEGSALDMPFADASFDAVWMQNVGMNIADKRRLYREIHRVLKPGGRFAFQEMVAGRGEASYFPLPWATLPTDNLLVSADDMRALLADGGFAADYFEDVSDVPLPAPAAGTPDGVPQAPLSLSVYVDNLAQKAENATRSVREGQIRLYRGVFRASRASA